MSRWRWRLRGATMWPAFALLTITEGVVFDALPFSGDGPGSFYGALLLAAGLNLVVVAALAPLGGMLLRRRRPDLPRAIAADQAGSVLLAALFAALVAAGLVNRSSLEAEERALTASFAATTKFVRAQAPHYTGSLRSMDAVRVEPGMYRTCVPGSDPTRPLCLFVNTDQSPPGVTRDPARIPNAEFAPRF